MSAFGQKYRKSLFLVENVENVKFLVKIVEKVNFGKTKSKKRCLIKKYQEMSKKLIVGQKYVEKVDFRLKCRIGDIWSKMSKKSIFDQKWGKLRLLGKNL